MQVYLRIIMLEVQELLLYKQYTNISELFKHVIIHTS